MASLVTSSLTTCNYSYFTCSNRGRFLPTWDKFLSPGRLCPIGSFRSLQLSLQSQSAHHVECRSGKDDSLKVIPSKISPYSLESLRIPGVERQLAVYFMLAAPSLFSFPASAAEQLVCSDELGGADPNTVFVIACVAEFLALTGAAVGGILARQRKAELEVINSQLRQINLSLRKQARVESYAPGLSYAPVGGSRVGGASLAPTGGTTRTLELQQEDIGEAVLGKLKLGKRRLREQKPKEAAVEFEAAMQLAKKAGLTLEQKKAARGLGASYQRQKKFKEAIQYHKAVLEISEISGEASGDTEAYGAIADCYTEIGDLECAAKYYDKYIEKLEGGDGNSD